MKSESCSHRHTDTVAIRDHQHPPQHLVEEILDRLNKSIIFLNDDDGSGDGYNDNDNDDQESGYYWLEDVQEAKSAQQEVYILRFGCSISHKTLRRRRRRHLSLSQQSQKEKDGNNDEEEWTESMITGQNRLVLRIWKGGSRWWNLNRNENPYTLARLEIMGYQIARNSFYEHYIKTRTRTAATVPNSNSNSDLKKSSNLHIPKIPRVLYFRSSYTTTRPSEQQKKTTLEDPSPLCWAVLEYVGPDDDGFLPLTTSKTVLMETITTDIRIGEDKDNNNAEEVHDVEVDEMYLNGMIKVRTEFGFDEPHPRWGRVPVDQALQYARVILQEVLLPLHCYSSRVGNGILVGGEGQRQQQQQQISLFHQDDRNININDDAGVAQTYSSMVRVYRQAYKEVTLNQQKNQKRNKRELKEQGHCCEGDLRIEECIKRLERGLQVLEETMNSDDKTIIPQLDPVLVHLDLQPQNIIFGKKQNRLFLSSPSIMKATTVDNHDSPDYIGEKELQSNDDQPTVFSVLDWEDAAWADPRFDLILLCRKVCANRDQANALWLDYANALLSFEEERMTTDDDDGNCDGNDDDDNIKKNEKHIVEEGYTNTTNTSMGCPTSSESSTQKNLLGPIEPWLQLETVHSITTMTLQSTDLLKFGRNPWETKKDLWGKLQREFIRLEKLLT
jgi:hypothetical protein